VTAAAGAQVCRRLHLLPFSRNLCSAASISCYPASSKLEDHRDGQRFVAGRCQLRCLSRGEFSGTSPSLWVRSGSTPVFCGPAGFVRQGRAGDSRLQADATDACERGSMHRGAPATDRHGLQGMPSVCGRTLKSRPGPDLFALAHLKNRSDGCACGRWLFPAFPIARRAGPPDAPLSKPPDSCRFTPPKRIRRQARRMKAARNPAASASIAAIRQTSLCLSGAASAAVWLRARAAPATAGRLLRWRILPVRLSENPVWQGQGTGLQGLPEAPYFGGTACVPAAALTRGCKRP